MIVLLLGLGMHETIIQNVGELIKQILLAKGAVLGTVLRTGLLVKAEHGEGVEAKEH